jgi:hypothetical protein
VRRAVKRECQGSRVLEVAEQVVELGLLNQNQEERFH